MIDGPNQLTILECGWVYMSIDSKGWMTLLVIIPLGDIDSELRVALKSTTASEKWFIAPKNSTTTSKLVFLALIPPHRIRRN